MATPRLLAGGNPQIPKGEGDAPVRAWLDALGDGHQASARRVDALIAKAVPGVRRAVKYNSPLYGAPGREDWFVSLRQFQRYLKVAFLRGDGLSPQPPVASKTAHARYLQVAGDAALDERQFIDWLRQAAAQPGQAL